MLRNVTRLLAAEREPLAVEAPVVPIEVARGVSTPFVEPEWRLMVRLLGGVEVVSADGQVAAFEKSKALELVAWLVLHRRRPTRSAARAALWDVEVKDATFANVVSEARRALSAAGGSAEEWIARTLTDALPLHDGVISDADLLGARVRFAAGLSHRDAIEVLTPGVELIGGMPFAGTGYLWCDAEGHSSSLVLLAVDAATQLAAHHLALGDVEGVFWATGRGLTILNGHEELIALRMRAHAGRGDLSGVRSEWERYERSLLADPWAATEPSPKLAALRRELLSFGESRVRGSNS
jgi:two-component SAPR family response regulator